MKMVSMANKEKEHGEPGGMSACCDDAKYPYGTQISLGDEQIAALGLADLPKVGTVIKLQAIAKVVSVRSEEDKDGSADQSLSLQITDLGIDKGSSEADKASKIYDAPAE